MMLVEEHKISLDEKLSAYLPNTPPAWSSVTVRHLLTHTSGITDYTNNPGWRQQIRLDRTPEELMKPVTERPLAFQPGVQWRYSNSNYYLLGMMIEKISGVAYGEFVTERIFKPLGMTSTRVDVMTDVIPNRAAGYHWQTDKVLNAEYVSPTQKWAAGAVISTVLDMAKWAIALDEGKLLNKSSLQQMITPAKLNNGKETSYGFGNELDTDHNHPVAGHQGGGIAFNATLRRYVSDKLSVIVLCNLTQAPSEPIARHIASIYLPGISDAGKTGIEDKDPKLTEALKGLLENAARGQVDKSLFAPQAQDQVVAMVQQAGPRMLAPLGPMQSFTLLDETTESDKRVRRYRAKFEKMTLIWTFELTTEGKIIRLEPRPE
jgi:CubicO group peptidase (beta-lactamase class C family)